MYNISFDYNIKWKTFYYRNYKSKYKKHILCFPDHKNGVHRVSNNSFIKQNGGFCGESILINVTNLENKNIFIFGRFGLFNENINCLKISDIINTNNFINEDGLNNPYYIAERINSSSKYIINPKCKSWQFNVPISNQDTFCFYVYICELENIEEYKIVYKINSPSFYIHSVKRKKEKGVKLIKEKKDESIETESIENENKDLLKYNEILRSLDDKVYNNKKESKIDDNPTVVEDNFQTLDDCLQRLYISKPNTLFIQKNSNFVGRYVNTTETTPEREEISFLGSEFSQFFENANDGFEILDEYGNIRKFNIKGWIYEK